jgi:hypothetical protein
MKTTVLAALLLIAIPASALAGQQYDRSVEAAAIRIVAAKMGDLRGGFALDHKPTFVQPIDRSHPTHLSAPRGEWRDGMALATRQRPVQVSSF